MLAANLPAEPRRPTLCDVGDVTHLHTVESALKPSRVDVTDRAAESFVESRFRRHGPTVPL
jgi:hypothetical protein